MYINFLIWSHSSPVRTKHISPSPRPYHLDSQPLDSNPFPGYTGYRVKFLTSRGTCSLEWLAGKLILFVCPKPALPCMLHWWPHCPPRYSVWNPEAHWPCLLAYRQPQSCPLSEPMPPLLSKPTAPCWGATLCLCHCPSLGFWPPGCASPNQISPPHSPAKSLGDSHSQGKVQTPGCDAETLCVWVQPPLHPLPAQALPACSVPQALDTVPHHYVCTDSSPSACTGAFCECYFCQHTILAQGCLDISPPPAQQISLGLCAFPASSHWLTLLGRLRELLVWVGFPRPMLPGTCHSLSRTLITLTVTCTMAVFPLRARIMSVSLTAVTPLPGIALSS